MVGHTTDAGEALVQPTPEELRDGVSVAPMDGDGGDVAGSFADAPVVVDEWNVSDGVATNAVEIDFGTVDYDATVAAIRVCDVTVPLDSRVFVPGDATLKLSDGDLSIEVDA